MNNKERRRSQDQRMHARRRIQSFITFILAGPSSAHVGHIIHTHTLRGEEDSCSTDLSLECLMCRGQGTHCKGGEIRCILVLV